MTCPCCRERPRVMFYRGKKTKRCKCFDDHRTPVEIRRDTVLDRYGDNPEAYTPAVLDELARDGLFDIAASFCPAGKLTLEEAKRREASTILANGELRQ